VLKRELARQHVRVLASKDGVIVAPRNAALMRAVRRGALSLRAFFLGRIKQSELRRLPERTARHAEVWNWAMAAQHGGMSKRESRA
jgi:hypothetical protein